MLRHLRGRVSPESPSCERLRSSARVVSSVTPCGSPLSLELLLLELAGTGVASAAAASVRGLAVSSLPSSS
eukprot:4766260-Alexandrium_andersonii.AAC.1